MNKPEASKRFPAWLRHLGGLAFGLLGLVTILIVARWLLMNSGHQATMRIVGTQRKKPASQLPLTPTIAAAPAVAVRGTPLASVPHFGAVLAGDKEAWKEFSKKLDEISAFLRHKKIHPSIVDGVWSFRAILKNLGIEVPETMTEAQAAAEYLKQADRFSALLAQWREAVATGPLEKGADYRSDPGSWRFSSLSHCNGRLLEWSGQAHLQAGDVAAAWADCQTLKNADDRVKELFPLDSYYGNQGMDYHLYALAKSGVQSGAWADDQLAELSSEAARQNALAVAQRDQENEKNQLTDFYSHFHEHEEQFRKDFLNTPSPVNQMINQVKLSLTTDQQIQDNLDLMLYRVDQRLSHFDPETGFYVRPTAEEIETTAESQGPSGSFYFFLCGPGQQSPEPWAAREVIQRQSDLDQLRLAAALETYQHRAGEYPDRLESINGQFPDGAPLDIATGKPYLYQRNADGGYTLWGTGIDGKSEGGDEKTDVTWTHRPVKGK